MDSTNYFVEHGAVLLAALTLCPVPRQEGDADLLSLIDSASARDAGEHCQGIWPKVTVLMSSMPACSLKVLLTKFLRQLSDTLDFARKRP